MKVVVTIALLILLSLSSAFAGDKYPLTMKADFTEGKSVQLHRTTHRSGDYDCTSGDDHDGPVCRTLLEWSELDRIAGSPDIVVFTLEDGSKVGAHSMTVNKIPGYIECSPASDVIFCTLYFEMLKATLVNTTKAAKYGQSVLLSPEEYMAASAARHRELFGPNDVMTVPFRYRLNDYRLKAGRIRND